MCQWKNVLVKNQEICVFCAHVFNWLFSVMVYAILERPVPAEVSSIILIVFLYFDALPSLIFVNLLTIFVIKISFQHVYNEEGHLFSKENLRFATFLIFFETNLVFLTLTNGASYAINTLG